MNAPIILTTLLFTLGLLFTQCNKNNQVAKKIDGAWKMDRIIEGGSGIDINKLPLEVSFRKCKANKSNCDGEWVAVDGSVYNFVYTVNEDGQTFIWGEPENGNSSAGQAYEDMSRYAGIWEVTDQTDTRFILTSSTCNGCFDQFRIEMSR